MKYENIVKNIEDAFRDLVYHYGEDPQWWADIAIDDELITEDEYNDLVKYCIDNVVERYNKIKEIVFCGYFVEVAEFLQDHGIDYPPPPKRMENGVYVGDAVILDTPIGYILEFTGYPDDQQSAYTWQWLDVENRILEIIPRY